MLIALTGTPGTGKTSVAKVLEREYRVIYLKDFEDARMYYDEERKSYVVDIDMLKDKVKELKDKEKVILEGHYSHDMPVDLVIVLRCHPDELRKRLEKRGYIERKIRENLEAEAMGLITSEAINYYGKDKVFEVDTTGREPKDVAEDVRNIIERKDEKFRPRINYMGEILKWY
ncbi:putative nucleoside kinase, CMP and AMP kinase [Aciduliprofundum sp. MAR08-339]|uniref:adenylate kinase family protein n=1 Tax=Aciduliprofundum sp. (strain MAR08-339) TaxID=673860 RepID=UPI0002A47E89|nr:putative nucleoside kinase, CMP and AMP kinase [Aciduliprofundum sp. MAR08-339]